MYKTLTVQQLPKAIKSITSIHQDPGVIQFFECEHRDDLYELSLHFPFEVMAMKNKDALGIVIGYFMVGIAVPTSADTFRRPVIAFHHMNPEDWRLYGQAVKEEVDKRKRTYMENRGALRDIRNSR